MRIRRDDLSHPAVRGLIEEHLANMRAISPPESVHALPFESLKDPAITFWTAWEGEELLGCAALKEIDTAHGEVKSMRTPAAHRGRGAAKALLAHLVAEATARGYRRLSLETGAQSEFAPAHRLYQRFGFAFCGPFEGYIEDPNSVFMTRAL